MPARVREAEFAFEDRDRSVRDVVAHLYEWHRLFIDFVRANTSGQRRPFLPEPYTWKTYGDLNIVFRDRHHATTLPEALDLLDGSHREVIELIESFNDEELFTKRYFDWTGTTSLGSYAVSATSSHDEWAMKKVRKHLRTA